MIGWLIGGLIALIAVVAVWETFAPFVKSILDRYVYKYFRLFVKWLRGKLIGEVVLDGERTYERELDENEVPEEIRRRAKNVGRADVTYDKELRMQLGL